MKKILVITVGGSCEPIVNAIKGEIYDKIFFVCSEGGEMGSERTVDGPGRPCKKDGNDKDGEVSIVKQINVPSECYEKFMLSQSEIDDLSACYQKMKQLAKEINDNYPDVEVVANFTGGTKTMSASLVTLAVVYDWELSLNVAPRDNLVKVKRGDIVVSLKADGLLADRYKTLIARALKEFNFSMAKVIAEEFIKKISDNDLRYKWQVLHQLLLAFSLWDSFLYRDAYKILQNYGKFVRNYLPFLNKLSVQNRSDNGYYVVIDLIYNAERKAIQHRFDDAVSRLYRATELLAQTRLKKNFELQSGKLTLERLKQYLTNDQIKEYEIKADEQGIIRLGLTETYKLLAKLDDKLGKMYIEAENTILDALKKRNNSFLAHGFLPIERDDFEDMYNKLSNFLFNAIKDIVPKLKNEGQLPRLELLNCVEII